MLVPKHALRCFPHSALETTPHTHGCGRVPKETHITLTHAPMFTVKHLDLHTPPLCVVHVRTHKHLHPNHACTCVHVAKRTDPQTHKMALASALMDTHRHRYTVHPRRRPPGYVCAHVRSCTHIHTHTSVPVSMHIYIHLHTRAHPHTLASPEALNFHAYPATCPHSHKHNQMPAFSHVRSYVAVLAHT